MLRKFNIKVDGVSYEVEMEDLNPVVAAAPVAAVTTAPAEAAAPAPVAATGAGAGTPVTAPMPGNIWSVNVTVGQQVNAGDVLLVLEAMKMENEIVAEQSGTVTGIAVQQGQTVDSGAVLLTIQ